jgi:SecD/SecF fusion protein
MVYFGLPEQPEVKLDYGKAIITIDVPSYASIDNNRLRKIITTQGKFEIWNTYENEELIYDLIAADTAVNKWKQTARDKTVTVPDSSVIDLILIEDSLVLKPLEKDTSHSLLRLLHPLADNQSGIYPGPAIGLSFDKDTAKVNRLLAIETVRNQFPKDVKFLWADKPYLKNNVFQLYALKSNPGPPYASVSGDVVMDANYNLDQYGRHELIIKIKPRDTDMLEKMTNAAAHSTIKVDGKKKTISKMYSCRN